MAEANANVHLTRDEIWGIFIEAIEKVARKVEVPRYMDQFDEWRDTVLRRLKLPDIAKYFAEALNKVTADYTEFCDLLTNEMMAYSRAVTNALKDGATDAINYTMKHLAGVGKTILDSIKDVIGDALKDNIALRAALSFAGELLDHLKSL